jgi:putative spermidine/putrescine transport system substrate-binding protein
MSSSTARHTDTSRRRLLRAAAGISAAALAPFPALVRAKPNKMVIASGGGALDEAYKVAYYEPWRAKTGIEIVSSPNPGAQLKAMVEQKAVEWDVAQVAAELAATLARQGLLEPLDYSIIDKSALLPGTAHEYLLMSDIAAYHIAWNTKQFRSTPPQDWAQFWKAPGRHGLWKRPFQTMEVALMADGVAPDKLYPLDVERALRSLDKLKANIFWWERGAQVAQILIDGEVELSAAWNGRVHQPKLDGAPVDFHFNQAIFISDAWVVPKGAPNKRESMEFIASTLAAERQAEFARKIPYGPVNPAALKLLDAQLLRVLPSSSENFKKGTSLDINWWADNGDKTTERFNKWLLG